MNTPEFLYGISSRGTSTIVAVKDIITVTTEGESPYAVVHYQQGDEPRWCIFQSTVEDVAEALNCRVLPTTRDS